VLLRVVERAPLQPFRKEFFKTQALTVPRRVFEKAWLQACPKSFDGLKGHGFSRAAKSQGYDGFSR
jgi:hypothetical protein